MADSSAAPGLRSRDWQASYSHEDGDLVELFFVPALQRTRLYQRVTGYFSVDVLALAARGLNALIEGGGRMQLVVGCTLGPREIEQIEKGIELRELVQRDVLSRMELIEDLQARERLGWLAWLVAAGHLEIKVAIPKDEHGRFRVGLGLYHAKVGLLTDATDDRLCFEGSINETQAGWIHNVESFTVSCSWWGDKDCERIARAAANFAKLWSNRARSAAVLDFPEACRLELLKFLPKDDTFVRPPPPQPEEIAETPPLSSEEHRQLVWSFIANAPARPDGAMVAVKTSAVDPWPHQLRAYERMLSSWPCRLLIADEVGLGKTIEAGLVIRHAWISGLAKRILILAPAGVLPQWQAELYEKFNLLVPIYTGDALRWPEHHFRQGELERPIGRREWTKTPLVLASSHLMRRLDRQSELIEAEDWDLLVLDEAHHARRRGAGTKQERGPNRLLRLMEQINGKAKALLLLTATPMQIDPIEVWDLVRLLGTPEEWSDASFRDYFDQLGTNPDAEALHRLAKLFQAAERAYGPLPSGEVEAVGRKCELDRVAAEQVLSALREPVTKIPLRKLSPEQRRAALELLRRGSPLRARMSRSTRSLLREYHRRGILKEPIASREVIDIPIDLSPAERDVYESVENYISTTYQAAQPDRKTAVGFVMTVYRRRLASSFAALRATLQTRLQQLGPVEARSGGADWREDVSIDERADEAMSDEESADLASAALASEEASSLRALLRSVAQLGTDSKAWRLVDELRRSLASDYDAAIVFTQYTDTLDYLKEFIAEQLALPVGTFSGSGGSRRDVAGSWSFCSKERIKALLASREVRVLVCTDAAGEGLNLQSCGLLVNYDLPWNPMKVEQRIGRIDRIGQRHEKVRIINLAYRDTVEADVYFELQQRIGLFTGVVGKLQPILARLPRRFEAAVLTGADRRERARHEVLRDVQTSIDEAQAASFDIDEVSDLDVASCQLPASPVESADLERVLRSSKLLPTDVECASLDTQTFVLRIVGHAESARVTASPGEFDEHFESLQLFTYGGPVFERVLDSALPELLVDTAPWKRLADVLGPTREA